MSKIIHAVFRCACNGHAGRCGSDIDSVCDCLHNTEGPNCERCLPFYNDKPWRYGATNNAYPCKPCSCNNHATSCHYDVTVDPFPNSYEVGGGGVCDNCQDNTGKEFTRRWMFEGDNKSSNLYTLVRMICYRSD